MSQLDRHQTIEQLSALLDNQLSSEEQSRVQVHLDACPQCQQELADLRQTVMLLHALPTPALPRSFALPETITHAPATTTRTAAATTTQDRPQPIAIAAQRQQRLKQASPARAAFRLLSGLAAVVGIFFIFSGLLQTIPFMTISGIHGIPTTNSQANGLDPNSRLVTPQVSNTSNGHQSPPPASLQPTAAPVQHTRPTQEPVIGPAKTTPQVVQPPPQSLPVVLVFDLNSQGGRLSLGILFFLLGCCGIMYFSRQRAGPFMEKD